MSFSMTRPWRIFLLFGSLTGAILLGMSTRNLAAQSGGEAPEKKRSKPSAVATSVPAVKHVPSGPLVQESFLSNCCNFRLPLRS